MFAFHLPQNRFNFTQDPLRFVIFFSTQNVCNSCANVSLGILNPAQDNSVVYSPQSLFFLGLIVPSYKPVFP